jgi:hypothetical protein
LLPGACMSFTRGGPGRQRQFQWQFDPVTRQLLILNENHWDFMYSLEEVQKILQGIYAMFSTGPFRLSSRDGFPGEEEKEYTGFIRIILKVLPHDYPRAMGASYLGVVLEEAGFLQWNGQTRGIAWNLINTDFSEEALTRRMTKPVLVRGQEEGQD